MKNKTDLVAAAMEKADRFRAANRDIPNLAEFCIFFDIDRETLRREIMTLIWKDGGNV